MTNMPINNLKKNAEVLVKIWNVLIRQAKIHSKITYANLALAIGYSETDAKQVADKYLPDIERMCFKRKCPLLSMLVVREDTGLPGKGFNVGMAIRSQDEYAEYFKQLQEFDWQKKIKNPFNSNKPHELTYIEEDYIDPYKPEKENGFSFDKVKKGARLK